MKITFIGYGSMAKAIARGMKDIKQFTLYASAPSLVKGINQDKVHTDNDNKEAIKEAQVIILAVKPGQMSKLLEEISEFIAPQCLLISVAAGLNLSWLAEHTHEKQAIIRAMPNTPAAVGMAATALIANPYTNSQQKEWATIIFSGIGIIQWINKEEDIDTYTALSGSGPAYVFLFMELMIKAAITLGLEPSIAKTFTVQTFAGAIKLVQNSESSLIELRTRVTSPGGTTEAALNVLRTELDGLILATLKAAQHRSQELGNSEIPYK